MALTLAECRKDRLPKRDLKRALQRGLAPAHLTLENCIATPVCTCVFRHFLFSRLVSSSCRPFARVYELCYQFRVFPVAMHPVKHILTNVVNTILQEHEHLRC